MNKQASKSIPPRGRKNIAQKTVAAETKMLDQKPHSRLRKTPQEASSRPMAQKGKHREEDRRAGAHQVVDLGEAPIRVDVWQQAGLQ